MLLVKLPARPAGRKCEADGSDGSFSFGCPSSGHSLRPALAHPEPTQELRQVLNVCIHDLRIALLRSLKFRRRWDRQMRFVLTALHPQEQVENPWPVFYARLPACAAELKMPDDSRKNKSPLLTTLSTCLLSARIPWHQVQMSATRCECPPHDATYVAEAERLRHETMRML